MAAAQRKTRRHLDPLRRQIEGHETVAQVGRIKVDPLDETLFLSHMERLACERRAEMRHCPASLPVRKLR